MHGSAAKMRTPESAVLAVVQGKTLTQLHGVTQVVWRAADGATTRLPANQRTKRRPKRAGETTATLVVEVELGPVQAVETKATAPNPDTVEVVAKDPMAIEVRVEEREPVEAVVAV